MARFMLLLWYGSTANDGPGYLPFSPVPTMNSTPKPTSAVRYSAGNEHADYSLDEWKTAVVKNETDLGYHAWVEANGAMDEQDQARQLRQALTALNTVSAVAARGYLV